jgi:hypothetical protein
MKNPKALAFLNLVGFILTIILNGMANGLPINGKTTGELSDLYPNLFVPAGITFAIWGLIYLLLLVFIVYQLVEAFRKVGNTKFIEAIGPWFIVSSVANASWILAWHYVMPVLSLIIMIILLASLLKIYLALESIIQEIPGSKQYFIYPVFSIYLAWISVATIANTTTVLVHLGWRGGIFGEPSWAILMILVAIGFGIYFLIFRRNMYYPMVIIWALYGIYLKRSTASIVESGIILTAQIGLVLLVVSMSYLFFNKFLNPNKNPTQ